MLVNIVHTSLLQDVVELSKDCKVPSRMTSL